MQKKLLLFLPVLFLLAEMAYGQVPPPCPSNSFPGAESCQQACVYCDFDGYTGTNNGTPSGGNTVCGQITIHNDQWFGFIAGSTSISIDILTSNCQNGDGLQAAFFDDCDDDAIDCNPGVGGGAGIPLTLSYNNFVPGQTYYLMIDGYIADVCDFEIVVTNGSVSPPAPAAPSAPQGPTVVCPGAQVEYTIPPVPGAGYYRWIAPAGSQINGGTNNVLFEAPEGTTVTVTFGNSGGQLCVQAGNVCFPPQQACITIINQPIPPTVLPPVTVCFNDLPFIWEEEPFTNISGPGTFTLTSVPYDSYLGCDSTVKQTVTVKSPIIRNIGLQYICENGCYEINGTNYCEPGTFQETFESYEGCDSTVQFTVLRVPVVANIDTVAGIISCTNPILTLSGSNSSMGPGVSYTWTNASGAVLGNQNTQNVTAGGTYNLIVSNSLGGKTCFDTATVSVTQNINLPNISAQGGALTCLPGGGSVTLQGGSTTPGVNYLWTGPGITPANQNQQSPTVSVAGTYILAVTNPANNCVATDTVQVLGNNIPPSATATGGLISCLQSSIVIDAATNAQNPGFQWAGPGITPANQNLEDPLVSVAGSYTVTITDVANGCTSTATAVVDANTSIPTVSAGADRLITCADPVVTLDGSGAPNSVSFNWTGPGITPANQTLATPAVDQPGTYILLVTDTINGCAKSDTVLVDISVAPPVADAGQAQILNCTTTSVTLGGNGTSQGANFQILWTGPGINAGNQNLANPNVTLPGAYTLALTNTSNGCTASDTVAIAIDVDEPVVDAGPDQTLTCSTPNGVILQSTVTPANVTYLWTGPGIGANNATLPNPQVSQQGVYQVVVTNTVNGCTQSDDVTVVQDASVPAANAGQDLTLTCSVVSVNFNGSASSTGPNITYLWTGPGISPANANVQSPTGINLPGSYTLLVVDTSNNCENSDILIVSIDTLAPTAIAGADLVLNCFNNANDTLNATGSSTGANFSLLWSGPGINAGNQNSLFAPVSQPGTYDLVVTNTQNNCTATDQVEVTNDLDPPTADAGTDQIIDCVITSTTLGGNSSSGVDFAFSWTGAGINAGNQTVPQPVVSQAGNYTLVVTDTSNGCTATDEVTVTLNAVYPTADAGADLVLTCANPAQTLDGASSSSGANFQIVWTGPDINAGNQGGLTPNITLPGTYILSITDQTNSCVSVDTVLVQEDKVSPAASAGADLNLDCQITVVSLDGSNSASGASIVYLWSGPGINPANAGVQSPDVDQPGNYTLLVTNTANGCTGTDDVQVDQDITPPVASAGADLMLTCTQTSLTIDGSASSNGVNFAYLWQGPGINTGNFSLQNPIVSDSGTYLLTVTNLQNNCTSTDVVYVDADQDLPTVNAGPDQTLTCQNDTLALDGSASQSGANIAYTWSGPSVLAGTQTTNIAQVDQPGAYTLTVANSDNGCTNTDMVLIDQDIVPPFADAGSAQTITCATSSGVTLSGAASDTGPGYSLVWSGPGINAGNQNQINPVVTQPGTYSVLITNTANGCASTDQVTVSLDQDLPSADAGADQTITCAITQVSLDAGGSTASAPLSFLWSGPGINAGNQNQITPTVNQPGTYTLTATNSITGCQATDEVIVALDNAPPVVSAAGDTITCSGPEVILTATSSVQGSTFSWSGPDIDLGNMNLQNPQVGDPGTYTVVVTALNGCTATATALVSIDADVPLGTATGTQLNCLNNGQSTITGTVSTPGVTFVWTGPGNFSSTVLNPTVTSPGTYVLTLTAPNGCVKSYDTNVTADFTPPVVQALVTDQLDCSTTTVTINASASATGPNISYAWTTANGNILSGASTLTPVVDVAGDYTLVVTNSQNGCTNAATVAVTYDPAVPTGFNLTVRDIRCFGEQNGFIAITSIDGGTEPFQFSFNGGPLSGTALFSQLPEDTYTIQLVDAKGCTLDTTVAITAPDALQVMLEDDILIKLGESATVTATITGTTAIESITWNPLPPCASPDCLSYDTIPTHSYQQTITVRDVNGCISTDRQIIQVDRSRRIFVPNVFNPESSDPFNAALMIQGGNDIRMIHNWQVFDRWGNAIYSQQNFQPNDPAFAWDGKARGDDAAMGVYVWYVEVEFIDGEIELFEGDVTLLRQ